VPLCALYAYFFLSSLCSLHPLRSQCLFFSFFSVLSSSSALSMPIFFLSSLCSLHPLRSLCLFFSFFSVLFSSSAALSVPIFFFLLCALFILYALSVYFFLKDHLKGLRGRKKKINTEDTECHREHREEDASCKRKALDVTINRDNSSNRTQHNHACKKHLPRHRHLENNRYRSEHKAYFKEKDC
jgi:hypothetical protein